MPGAIFPPDGPRNRCSPAEAIFHEALRRQLPTGWRAWHSFRVCVPGQGEGEGDFVLAAPGVGMLIVEVKGGKIKLEGGRWYQNDKLLDPAPRQQAQRYARLLTTALTNRGAAVPPWEIVCAFPETHFSKPPVGADVDGLVLGERDLYQLGVNLPEFISRALGGRRAPTNNRWLDVLHELWGDSWVPSLSIPDRIEDAERQAIRLNAEQLTLLDFAGDNPRALVEGAAGTGKSVVARELAVRWARRGKRVLYLCFTDALGKSMAKNLEAERWKGLQIRATSIRLYARELLTIGGLEPPPPSTEFWDGVSLEAACEALPSPEDRPDLVVVDEAQDFEANDWLLVDSLASGGALWALGDERQRFWGERHVPDNLFPPPAPRLRLKEQHRNPDAIHRFALLYAPGTASTDVQPMKMDPSVLRVVVAGGAESDVLDRVRHELDGLRRSGVRPQDIAVLTLAGRGRSRLSSLQALGSHKIVPADHDQANQHVVGDTFLRFKGLDRPFVIVTELIESKRYDTRMHIALTRATVAVIVVCCEDELIRDERLRAAI